MSSDPPELGKGLFGYRKSAVNQIIADRDIMLRQAEGRVRAAESRVADLETELGSMRERNARMDEQIERLRLQLDALSRVGGIPMTEEPSTAPPTPAPTDWDEQSAAPAVEASGVGYGEETPAPVYGDEEPAPAYGDEEPIPAYGEGESLEAEGQWPGADQEWPGAEEPAPVVEAEAAPPATGPVEDELPYGVEVQLGEDTGFGTPEPEWMHTGPAASGEDQEQHDEVAMAAGGYAYGDYGSQPETGRYGDYVSQAEEEEESPVEAGEAPSPFGRFPFTSEPFDHAGAEVATGTETSAYQDEPVAQAQWAESQPSAPEAPRAEAPEPAAESSERGPAVSPATTDITNRFLTEELAGILAAAEESAARIVERARTTTQRQIARSNRVWREVQAEVARFASWREEVEPVIRAVQSKVDGVRTEIEEVPERIRQALAPMADSISSIDGDLADLAAACNPPLLLAPGGLESEDADQGSWGHDADEDEDEDFEGHTESTEGVFDESFGGASNEPFGGPYDEGVGDQGSGHLHAG